MSSISPILTRDDHFSPKNSENTSRHTTATHRCRAIPASMMVRGTALFLASLVTSAAALKRFGGQRGEASVPAANNPISLANFIPTQAVQPQEEFYFPLGEVFNHIEGGPIHINATLADGGPLPAWLQFDPILSEISWGFTNGYPTLAINNQLCFSFTTSLDIFDISNPIYPFYVSSYKLVGRTRAVAVENNIIYMIDGGYLSIVDISDPNEPHLLGNSTTYLRDPEGIAISKNAAFITDRSSLKIFDVSNPAQPKFLGSHSLSNSHPQFNRAYQIAILDNIASVVIYGKGVEIINVTNPNQPTDLSFYSSEKNPFSVWMAKDYLYLSERVGCLKIIDITNPINPYQVGHYQSCSSGYDVFVSNSTAYLIDVETLRLINVENSTQPQLEKSVALPGNWVRAAVDENFAIVSNTDFETGYAFLNILDIHSPRGILTGTPSHQNLGVNSIKIVGFDALGNSTYTLFDLYIGRSPFVLNSITGQSIQPNHPFTLNVNTQNSFSDPDNDFLSLSASTPAWLTFKLPPQYQNAITLLSEFEILPYYCNIEVDNHLLYLVGIESDFQIFDISAPTNPTLIGLSPMQNQVYDFVIRDNLAFITVDSLGLQILDLTDPSDLQLLGSYNTYGHMFGVDVSGNYACVIDTGVGLRIINVNNSSSPVLTATFGDLNFRDVSLVGRTAFVVGFESMYIIDFSTPSNPQLISSFNNPYLWDNIVVSRGFAYATNARTLAIIDVNDLNNPRLASTYDNPTLFSSPKIIGNLAFMGKWSQDHHTDHIGLEIVDISDPENPISIGSYQSLDHGLAVSATNTHVFLFSAIRDESNYDFINPNLQTFDITNWQFSGTPTEEDAGNLDLVVTAKDPAGLTASSPFQLRIEGAPHFVNSIANQFTPVNEPFVFFVDQDTFSDPNGDVIGYSARLNGTDHLPPWLSFSSTGIFSGLPSLEDVGVYTIKVEAFDGIVEKRAPAFFDINVANALEDQLTRVGGNFHFSMDPLITNPQGLVSYTVTQTDGSPLPTWLHFNPDTISFSGSPGLGDKKEWSILITADDGVQNPSSASFAILVTDNIPPRVVNPISNQLARVNHHYNFAISDTTFEDDNGDALTYTARKVGGKPLPSWLHFGDRTFSGKPGRSDTGDFGDKIIPIEVTASDGTAQVANAFDLTVEGTSYGEIALSIAAPAGTFAALALAWYKKRGIVLNPFNKLKYLKPKERINIEEEGYRHELCVPAKEVTLVKVYQGKSTYFGLSGPRWVEEFLTYDSSLPGGLLLPDWLRYQSGENLLYASVPPRQSDVGNYKIRAYSHGGVIKEEFILEVVDPNAHPPKIRGSSALDQPLLGDEGAEMTPL